MTKDEALKMAIEALNDSLTRFSTFNEMQHDAIQACKDALEQPEMTYEQGFAHGYEAHRAEWQGLTDDEVDNIYPCAEGVHDFRDIVRAIETKLKEKNT
jgi:chemotaxis regulatin CheY-phosphate phosphatase CheZ